MSTYSPVASTWRDAHADARAFMPVSDPWRLLVGMMCVADVAVVTLSSFGAFALRHGAHVVPDEIGIITLLAAALTFNIMWISGCYGRHLMEATVRQIGRAIQSWTMVMSILLLSAYLTKTSDDFSRIWAITWYFSSLIGFAVVRLLAAWQVRRRRRQGKLARTVAIVDLSGGGEALARRLLRASAGDMRLVGVFGLERSGERKNSVADLLSLARLFRIDDVAVSISGRDGSELEAVVRSLGAIPTNVRLCPEIPSLPWARRDAGILFGEPVLTILQRPLTGWNRSIKRAEDLVLSSILTVFLAPFLAILALLIKLDSPGPVLFRQARSGFNNNTINVLKFRTMVHQPTPETDVRQAQRNDPRVTRVGRVLRKLSLDELPQLFNVLRGEMSLVGPRPHAISHNDQYAALIGDYLSRHRVQPGITGWAQVNGLRGETDLLEKMERRVEFDLAYIESWSLSLDLRILGQTALMCLLDRNAY